MIILPILNGPCSVPWVRARVWVRVTLGFGLATGNGWVGTWPVTRLDPSHCLTYTFLNLIESTF